MFACLYNFTVTSTYIYFSFIFFFSSHHCSWYKIPIPLRSSIYRVVHFFPKHLWLVIPLCCQVKTAAASLCSAWHFFRCGAAWVEEILLLGVLQSSKVTSAISVLRINTIGYFVFSFLDVHIVVFWLLFWWVFFPVVVHFIYFLPAQFVENQLSLSKHHVCLFNWFSRRTNGVPGKGNRRERDWLSPVVVMV